MADMGNAARHITKYNSSIGLMCLMCAYTDFVLIVATAS